MFVGDIVKCKIQNYDTGVCQVVSIGTGVITARLLDGGLKSTSPQHEDELAGVLISVMFKNIIFTRWHLQKLLEQLTKL